MKSSTAAWRMNLKAVWSQQTSMCQAASGVSDSLWPYELYSLPGSSVHGISQSRILELVAISSSRGSLRPRDHTWISEVCCIGKRIFYFTISATWEAPLWAAKSCLTLCDPMNYTHQASMSFTTSWSLLKFMSIELVMPSNSHPLLPPSPPTLNLSYHQDLFWLVGSSHQVAKYWSFSFSIIPSNEYSGLISFRFDLSAVQGTLKSLLQHHTESLEHLGPHSNLSVSCGANNQTKSFSESRKSFPRVRREKKEHKKVEFLLESGGLHRGETQYPEVQREHVKMDSRAPRRHQEVLAPSPLTSPLANPHPLWDAVLPVRLGMAPTCCS